MSKQALIILNDEVHELTGDEEIGQLKELLDKLNSNRLYRYEQFAEAATEAAGKTTPYKTNYIRQLVSNNNSRGPDLQPHVVHSDLLDCSFLHEDALDEFEK